MVQEFIQSALQEKFAEPEYAHLFLVEIEVLPTRIVHVFVDGDQGIGLDECVRISRYLEAKLDESALLGDDYTLEVSSPGVGSPMRLWRQFPKNIGRELSVKLKDEAKHAKGILKEVREDSLLLEYEEKIPVEGKKRAKKKIQIQTQVAKDAIEFATVKISFR